MSKLQVAATIAGLAIVLLGCDLAGAQMFGRRQLGRPLARRPSPGFNQQQEDVGTLQGNERFLRQNRSPTDFVGPDLAELQRFIGVLQASTREQAGSSTQDIRRRVDRSATINQPLTPAPTGEIYNPRIDVSVSAELSPMPPGLTASNALSTLARSPQMSGSSRISVSMAGRTAILQGEVPSAKDRDLAEVLLSFEPGISRIRNELAVNPQLRVTQDSLQAWRDRQQPRQAWTTLSHGSTQATRAPEWESLSGRSD